MDFTGLGTRLSVTGTYLTFVFIFLNLYVKYIRSSTKYCQFCHRYLRFFSDGHVVMLTTPEDPLSVVPRLRSRNTRYPCSVCNIIDLNGYWIAKIVSQSECKPFHTVVEFCLQNRFCSLWSLPSVTGDRQSNQSFRCCLQEKGRGKSVFKELMEWLCIPTDTIERILYSLSGWYGGLHGGTFHTLHLTDL